MALPLGPSIELNLISAVFIFAAAAVPIYLAAKVRSITRRLALIFAIFIVIHGFYHVAVILGFELVGEGVLEPISVMILIFFGLSYLNAMRRSAKKFGGATN